MTLRLLPPTHHVARFCPKKHIAPDGRVTGEAFRLRDEEAGLSVNWLERIHDASNTEAINQLKLIFREKFTVKRSDWFAKLCVGRSVDYVLEKTREKTLMQFRHMPESDDASHSEIYDLRSCDRVVSHLLAESVIECSCAHMDGPAKL